MKEIIITKADHGHKVEKFVRKFLSDAPLSFIYKLFRVKDVKVNGKRIGKDYILSENDLLQIYVTDKQLEEFRKPRTTVKSSIQLDIVYEDENIIIINKPSGLLVHGDSLEKRLTLQNVVLNYLMEKGEYNPSNETAFTPAPCHRLDRNTSGLIVFGKNIESLHQLEELFKDKTNIKKEYLALVAGKLFGKGKIDAPLYKDEKNKTVYIRSISQGGKNALSYYESKKNFKDKTLLSVEIVTGRTHQIRVHLAHIGHPILGDAKYGNYKANKIFQEKYNYQNQFLHAYKLSFLEIGDGLSYLSNKTFEVGLHKKEKDIIEQLMEEEC